MLQALSSSDRLVLVIPLASLIPLSFRHTIEDASLAGLERGKSHRILDDVRRLLSRLSCDRIAESRLRCIR